MGVRSAVRSIFWKLYTSETPSKDLQYSVTYWLSSLLIPVLKIAIGWPAYIDLVDSNKDKDDDDDEEDTDNDEQVSC